MIDALIYLCIINGLIGFKIFWDWRAKNIKKRVINHLKSASIDFFLYFVSAFIFIGSPEMFGATILALSWRWLAFDAGFNFANGDDWYHFGKSSVLDNFLTKFTGPMKVLRWTIPFNKYSFLYVKAIPFIFGLILLLCL